MHHQKEHLYRRLKFDIQTSAKQCIGTFHQGLTAAKNEKDAVSCTLTGLFSVNLRDLLLTGRFSKRDFLRLSEIGSNINVVNFVESRNGDMKGYLFLMQH